MLRNIPANIITGFLGSGKTTAIRHLLAGKPEGERWAVLVNEFGETGIDGELLSSGTDENSVAIREVPGGCMCCAAGVPMRVALNQLLARARPHRLLIEPTGLGHPRQLITTLTGDSFASVLDLRAVITLLDARKLADTDYTSHDVFNQQLAVADLIVANKADLYSDRDHHRLSTFLEQDPALRTRSYQVVEQARLEQHWLDTPSHHGTQPGGPVAPDPEQPDTKGEAPLPEAGFLQSVNEGEGHVSAGWRFSEAFVFDYHRLERLIADCDAERIKGVVNTDQGRMSFNRSGDRIHRDKAGSRGETRIEFIARHRDALADLDSRLKACLVASNSG